MDVGRTQRGRVAWVAGAIAVAATYVYFLVFAQFGFLRAVRESGAGEAMIKGAMTVMAGAGIAGSVIAAKFYSEARERGMLLAGFAFAGGAALAVMVGIAGTALLAWSGVVGAGLGVVTVTLAGGLRGVVGARRLGLAVGVGTGLAYGVASWPAVFAASVTAQAWMAISASLVGLAVALRWRMRGEHQGASRREGGIGWGGRAIPWVVVFAGLVTVDSAVFYFIQAGRAEVGVVWREATTLRMNAAVHLVAAIGAGVWLDRGRVVRVVAAGAVVLLAGCVILDGAVGWFRLGVVLYVAGVSVYSVALVFVPAWAMRPWLAAAIYGIAGWGGSAAGIGLVEGAERVSRSGLAVGVGIVLGALIWAVKAKQNARGRSGASTGGKD